MNETLTQAVPLEPEPPRKSKSLPIKPKRRQFRVGRNDVDIIAKLALPDLEVGCYQRVVIKADAKNNAEIYVGRVGVTQETGFKLTAGDEIELTVDNLNSIYVKASRKTQAYCWLAN